MGANQNSLRRCREPRKPRAQTTKFDFAPVRRLLGESLLACLPAQSGQTIDEVLANLLVRIAAGWPWTEIGERLGFRQSLATVKIGPDFLSARRRSTRVRGVRLVWIGLSFWRCSGCWSIAGLAAGNHEKQAEKPDRFQCRANIRFSFRGSKLSLPDNSMTSH